MVTSDIHQTYRRLCKDLLLVVLQKITNMDFYYYVVILMESIKSNVSVNFVEGIQ